MSTARLATMGIAGLLAWHSIALAQQHPDTTRFEYLYIDGAFVPPHRSFPQGRERADWQCHDRTTQKTFSCTFVRGGFERFQYIFRDR